jgi:hypothetical protein
MTNRLILCLGLNHFMTKQTDTMSGPWPFHDKAHWYCVWGWTISLQNRLILCLGLDYFIAKWIDTMSGSWPLHDKTDWYYVSTLTISWQNRLKLFWGLTISWKNSLTLCLGLEHFMRKQNDTMSGASTFHEKTGWYYVWGLTISLITKQTNTIFGAWPLQDKTNEAMSAVWLFHYQAHLYYVWALTISWQNRLTLYLGIDHFMKKRTDSISGFWPFH